MRFRLVWLGCALLILLSGCNLSASDDGTDDGGSQPLPGTPSVQIISPQNGAEVIVNTRVLVSVTATDSVGVTRAQLFANGSIVKTVSSEAAGGEQIFNAVLDFTPRETGEVELEVIAYRASIASAPAELTVIVRQSQAQITNTPVIVPQTNVPIITPNDPTCRVVTQTNLNLRQGPDTIYPVIRILPSGSVLPIIGRIATNQWWQVRDGSNIGWVSTAFVLVYGNCALIPIVNPPPPPVTLAPTFTPTRTNPPPTPTTAVPTNTTPPNPPDLVIASIAGGQNLTLGAGNTPVTTSYGVTITNTGGSASGQFSNTIQVQPGGSEVQLGVVAGLNPGESIVLTANLTFATAGAFTITARADAGSQVAEISEVNNTGITTVTVNAAP
ncbi:MAG: CARDB domain-containing protein [bacterium]|nr:CARDB domain-containing protein [bacterium]